MLRALSTGTSRVGGNSRVQRSDPSHLRTYGGPIRNPEGKGSTEILPPSAEEKKTS